MKTIAVPFQHPARADVSLPADVEDQMNRKRFWHFRTKKPAAAPLAEPPAALPLASEHLLATAIVGRLQDVLRTHEELTATLMETPGGSGSSAWEQALRAQEALREVLYWLEVTAYLPKTSAPPTVTSTGETLH
jgi:hypothetical protein